MCFGNTQHSQIEISLMRLLSIATNVACSTLVWRRQPSFSSFLGGRGKKSGLVFLVSTTCVACALTQLTINMRDE